MGFFNRKQKVTLDDLGSYASGLPIKELNLKEYAVNVCANYIARTFSQSQFVINDKRWSYRFNIRPNDNQSGAEFWRAVVYQLIKEGDALVVLTDNDTLLLADDKTERNYDLYPSQYTNVRVGDYIFKRTFYADDVFHFRLANDEMRTFTESIYQDYEKLIGALYSSVSFSNQLRFKLTVNKRMNLKKENENTNDAVAKKYINAIENNSVVALVENETVTYDELNTPEKTALNIAPLDDAVWSFVDKVAAMLGIPAVLLHGEIAGVQDAMQMFYTNCIEPLNQLIEDEINAKIFKEKAFNKEDALNILGVNRPNPFALAEQIDKLISSGAMNRNEIRSLIGYDKVDGLDEFVITKNYETAEQNNDNQKKDEDG